MTSKFLSKSYFGRERNAGWRNAAFIFLIILFFSGCSTYTKSTNFKNEVGLVPTTKSTHTLQGGALIAIRWPASVDDKAKLALLEIEKGNTSDFKYISNAFDPLSLASTYYAMEAYRKMMLHLQPTEIVLEPQILTTNDNGSLRLMPIMDNKLPIAFAIDILEFKTGLEEHNWDFSPTLMISTGAAASPSTCGIVASTKLKSGDLRHDDKKFYLGYTDANDNCRLNSARSASQIDFVINDYLTKLTDHQKECSFSCSSKGLFFDEQQSKISIRNKLPLTPNEVMLFPNTWEDFSSEYMKMSSLEDFDNSANLLQNQTLEIYAQAVSDGIGKYNLNKASEAGLVEYLSIFDKNFADRYSKLGSVSLSEEDVFKLEVIKGFANEEKTYLNKLNSKLVNHILDGEFGKKFRAVRLEYYKKYQAKVVRDIAGVLIGAAAGAAGGMALSSGTNVDLSALNVAAFSALMKLQSDGLKDEQDFYSQFGAVLDGKERLLEVIIRGKIYNVDAKDLLSLREELKKIYKELFPV